MTLTVAQGIGIVATLAVASGLWAAHMSVNSAIHGPEWALRRMRPVPRLGLIGISVGLVLAVVVTPGWIGLGVAYVAGVIALTARAMTRGLNRLQQAASFEPLPVHRQSALVGRVGIWLMIIGALGAAVGVIDFESRGAPALFDFVLAGVLVATGLSYRRRASQLVE